MSIYRFIVLLLAWHASNSFAADCKIQPSHWRAVECKLIDEKLSLLEKLPSHGRSLEIKDASCEDPRLKALADLHEVMRALSTRNNNLQSLISASKKVCTKEPSVKASDECSLAKSDNQNLETLQLFNELLQYKTLPQLDISLKQAKNEVSSSGTEAPCAEGDKRAWCRMKFALQALRSACEDNNKMGSALAEQEAKFLQNSSNLATSVSSDSEAKESTASVANTENPKTAARIDTLKQNIQAQQERTKAKRERIKAAAQSRQEKLKPLVSNLNDGNSSGQTELANFINRRRKLGQSTAAGKSTAPAYACTPGARATASSSVPFVERLLSQPAICQPDNDPFVIMFHPSPTPFVKQYGPWVVGGDMSKEEWKNVYRHVGHISPYEIIHAEGSGGKWSNVVNMSAMQAAQELGRTSGGGFYNTPQGDEVRSLYRDPIGLNITHWFHDDEPEAFGLPRDAGVLARWKHWFVEEMLAARQEAGKPAPQMITNYVVSFNDPAASWNGLTGSAAYRDLGFTHGSFSYYSYTQAQGADVLNHLFSELLLSLRIQPNALELATADEKAIFEGPNAGYYPRAQTVDSQNRFALCWIGNAWDNGPTTPMPPEEYASHITLATLDGNRYYTIFTPMSDGHLGASGISTPEAARINADAIYAMATAARAFESTKNTFKDSDYTYNFPLQNKRSNILFRSRTKGSELWFAGIALSGSDTAQVTLPASSGTLTNLSNGETKQVSGGQTTVPLNRITSLYYFAPAGVTPPSNNGGSSGGSGTGGTQPTPSASPTAQPNPSPTAQPTQMPAPTPSATPSPTPSATPNPSASFSALIDVGGSRIFKDSSERTWSADYGKFIGGSIHRTRRPMKNIAGATLPDAYLYRTQIYGSSAYTVKVPNGSYALKLYFADDGYLTTRRRITKANQRVFSINIEGQSVPGLQNIDLFKEAGNKLNIGFIKTANVAVNDGELSLDFIVKAGFSLLNAIEISGTTTGSGSSDTGSSSPSSPVNGLLGQWQFDETGPSAVDASGRGAAGSLVNGPTRVAGKTGNALRFDGVDDYVNVSGITAPSSAITYAAWVNLDGIANTANDHRIIAALALPGSNSTHSFLAIGDWGTANDTRIGFAFNRGDWNDSTRGAGGSTHVPLTGWHHVAAAYDGSTVHFYLDGQLDSVQQIGEALPSEGAYAFTIGTRGALAKSDLLFEGSLDDVRLYGRALSDSEVAAIYSSTGGSSGGNSSNGSASGGGATPAPTPSAVSTVQPTPVQSSQPHSSTSYACTPGAKATATSSVPFASQLFSKPAICQPDNDPFVTIFHYPDRQGGQPFITGAPMSRDDWSKVYRHVGHIGPYDLMRVSDARDALWGMTDKTPFEVAQGMGRATGGGFMGNLPSGGDEDTVRRLFRDPIGLNITHWLHDFEVWLYTGGHLNPTLLARMKQWYVEEMLTARRAADKPAPLMVSNWEADDRQHNQAVGGLAGFRSIGFNAGNWQYYSYIDADPLQFMLVKHPQNLINMFGAEPSGVNGVRASVDDISKFGMSMVGIASDQGTPTSLPAEEWTSLITLGTLEGMRSYFVFTPQSAGMLGHPSLSHRDNGIFNANSIYAMARAANWFESTKNSFKDSVYMGIDANKFEIKEEPLLDASDNVFARARKNRSTNEQWFAGVAWSGTPSVRIKLSAPAGTLTNLATGDVKSVSGGVATIQLGRISELYHFKPN